MYPELFKIGPFTVYSYGLMLGIAFIVASYILTKEVERRKMDPNIATEVTLISIIFGIIGAKLFHLFENWDAFINIPLHMAFSPGGLTFHGGLILVIIAVLIYSKRKKIPFLTLTDLAAPSLALAYGIARIGCHLAGDGDYGTPTDLPWSAVYSNGTYPPSLAFRGFPDIVAKYGTDGIVPNDIPVHPAPIYEFLLGMLGFGILLRMRRTPRPAGALFIIYLILSVPS